MRSLLLSLSLLACHPEDEVPQPQHATAPTGEQQTTEGGAEYLGSARQLAARAAPAGMPTWPGPWEVTVYARDPEEPGPTALAAALHAETAVFEGLRPMAARGQMAVIWLTPPHPTQLPPQGPRSKDGAVIAALGPGDRGWAESAMQKLPWNAVSVVDIASSTGLWADPALLLEEPRVAGMVAAHVIADHFDLAWTSTGDTTNIPGLREYLGTPADPGAADPRARATGLDADTANMLVEDPEMAVRLAVAHATDSQQVLLALAADTEPLVRARAADRLDDLPRLVALATDDSSVVRIVATHRLAAMANQGEPTEDLAQALRTIATDSPDAYQRWKAAWGLGACPGQVEILSTLARDPDVDVRREAASALGRLGDPAALTPLSDLLTDPNNFLRAVAARAIGELGDPAAKPVLRAAVEDPAAQVSDAAAKSLTVLGEPTRGRGFRPPAPPRDDAGLVALLSSDDGTILKDACKFAAGREGAADLLLPLTRHPDGEVRKATAQALGWSDGAATMLVPMLADEDPDVVVTTLESLRRVGGFDPAVLEPALVHPDAEYRLRAAEALAALGPGERLRALAADPDERVRAAVARTMPGLTGASEPSVLVRRAATRASPGDDRWRDDPSALVRFLASQAPDPHGIFWARGVIAGEDDLVYLRFSFNDERDRPSTSRALLPPVAREYGHPDRG